MKNDLIFKTNLFFESVSYFEETQNWHFAFEAKTSVSFEGFWRLFKSNKIAIVCSDYEQQFAHQETLDLVSMLNAELKDKVLNEIKVDKYSGDLTLTIQDDIRVEFYTSSSGYETYQLNYKGEIYVGMGGGSVAIVVPTEDQQRFESKMLE